VERRLERSDSKIGTPPSYITNNLPLVALLFAITCYPNLFCDVIRSLQIILAIGALEVWDEYQFDVSEDKEPHYMRGGQPGKFANKKGSIFPFNLYDPFGFNKGMSDEKRQKRLVTEVNNGRLAMIGIFGFLAEGAVPGSVPLLKGIIPSYTGNVMIPFEGDFHWLTPNYVAVASSAAIAQTAAVTDALS